MTVIVAPLLTGPLDRGPLLEGPPRDDAPLEGPTADAVRDSLGRPEPEEPLESEAPLSDGTAPVGMDERPEAPKIEGVSEPVGTLAEAVGTDADGVSEPVCEAPDRRPVSPRLMSMPPEVLEDTGTLPDGVVDERRPEAEGPLTDGPEALGAVSDPLGREENGAVPLDTGPDTDSVGIPEEGRPDEPEPESDTEADGALGAEPEGRIVSEPLGAEAPEDGSPDPEALGPRLVAPLGIPDPLEMPDPLGRTEPLERPDSLGSREPDERPDSMGRPVVPLAKPEPLGRPELLGRPEPLVRVDSLASPEALLRDPEPLGRPDSVGGPEAAVGDAEGALSLGRPEAPLRDSEGGTEAPDTGTLAETISPVGTDAEAPEETKEPPRLLRGTLTMTCVMACVAPLGMVTMVVVNS